MPRVERFPTPGGRNPLHYAAAYSNDPEFIRLLIRRGAEVNAEDNLGTHLYILLYGKMKIVEWFGRYWRMALTLML